MPTARRGPHLAAPTGLLVGLLAAQVLAAQDAPVRRHQLGLALALDRYHGKDLVLSPLTYRGTHPAAGLSWLHDAEGSFHTAELQLGVGEINSSVPEHAQLGVRAQAWYGYGRRVATPTLGGRDTPIFVGALVKSFADLAFPQDYDNGTWIASHSLNLAMRARYALDAGQSLSWELHLPVVSYVVRPTWAGTDEELFDRIDGYSSLLTYLTGRGSVVALHDYLLVFTRVAWQRRLSSRFDVAASYRFYHHQYDRPWKVEALANQLALGLVFRL